MCAPSGGRRSASGLPVHRAGGPQRRRAAGPVGAASSCPHRRRDGRARSGRCTAGARVRFRRNRSPGGEVLLADYKGYQRLAQLKHVLVGGRRCKRAVAVPGVASVGGSLPWDDDLPPVRACPDDERGALLIELETVSGARRHPAWAGCSTLFRRWSPEVVDTKPRRPSNWKA